MLNSSVKLIGSEFSPIDWRSGGTGKQNISHKALEGKAVGAKLHFWIDRSRIKKKKKGQKLW